MKWDFVLPPQALGAAGFLSIFVFSIFGCFAYYPAPDETLAELNLAKGEALSAALSGESAHALHWIPICESWNNRLQVGTYLRRWRLSEYQRIKARVFRDKLENLEHMVENEDHRDEIRSQVAATSRAFARLSSAFHTE